MLALTALKIHFLKKKCHHFFFPKNFLLPWMPLKTPYIGTPCPYICQCGFIVIQAKKKERKDIGIKFKTFLHF